MVGSYLDSNDDSNVKLRRKALDVLQDLIHESQDAVKSVGQMIDAWAESKDIRKLFKDVVKHEKAADQFKRKAYDMLSKATSLLQREDIMRLVSTIDQIADNAEGSAHLIDSLTYLEVPKDLKKEAQSLFDRVDEAVSITRKVILILPRNISQALKNAQKIDDIEREIDDIQRNTVHNAVQSDMNAGALHQYVQLIKHLETIADVTEDIADAIRIYGLGLVG
ncbi:MAG: DUF47 domain-containing protein [Candidatus Ranarchaeia archaeon]